MAVKSKMTELSAVGGRQLEVSSSVRDRMQRFVDLLRRWRNATNLVSEASMTQIWTRHVDDSVQLIELARNARIWLDLGTGAGFPGMVIAIALSEISDAVVHCVESDARKCAFLREVVRSTAAPARIHACRIDELDINVIGMVDVVTARAVGSLPKLVEFSRAWLDQGAIGIFPRGRSAESQISALEANEQYEVEIFPSAVDNLAKIVRIHRAPRVAL